MTLCNSSLVSNTFKANEMTFYNKNRQHHSNNIFFERHIKAIKHLLTRGSVAQSG